MIILFKVAVAFPLFEEGKVVDPVIFGRTALFELKAFVDVVALSAKATLPPGQGHFDAAATAVATALGIL